MTEEYEFSAKIYDPMLYFALRSIRKTVTEILLPYRDKVILDLCCGTGNQLKYLAKAGFQDLHCLDISEAMLNIARRGGASLKIYREDATRTSLSSASFDVVLVSFALHEKDRPTQEGILSEAHRLLVPGGLLLIVDYAFDEKTVSLGQWGITLIERIAGGEHYRNFKAYLAKGGLSSLISEEKFDFIGERRMGLGGVTISRYHKR
jgi:demethylmenaquinone methyltransferase/2-methoxy-6-polyprenyl-1,4-benzoquinol methylase